VAWAAQRRSAQSPAGSKNPQPKRLKSCLGSAKTCPAGMHRSACGAAAGMNPRGRKMPPFRLCRGWLGVADTLNRSTTGLGTGILGVTEARMLKMLTYYRQASASNTIF
jgi:hypothetical protein